MAWFVLVVSALFESVWAVALSASHGFTRLWPSVIFFVGAVISMGGLAIALRSIPVGTGYAVWVGIGAVGTALYGMVVLEDPVNAARITCLGLIIGGVIGLQLLE